MFQCVCQREKEGRRENKRQTQAGSLQERETQTSREAKRTKGETNKKKVGLRRDKAIYFSLSLKASCILLHCKNSLRHVQCESSIDHAKHTDIQVHTHKPFSYFLTSKQNFNSQPFNSSLNLNPNAKRMRQHILSICTLTKLPPWLYMREGTSLEVGWNNINNVHSSHYTRLKIRKLETLI